MSGTDKDRTAKAFDLFDDALELPTDQRKAWVEERVGGDTLLAEAVFELLSAHESLGVLDRPLPTAWPSQTGVGGDVARAAVRAKIESALGEQYDRFELLGHGGMGVVFKAHERKHDRAVAIKVLRPEVAFQHGEERFLQEVRFASRLTHPHILAFLDSGNAGGLLYYVMPFVDAETLYDRVRRDGPLTSKAALPLLRDVADALAYAHEHGVLHRDLKPANILCTSNHAYLMDFGIAKALDRDDTEEGLTRPGFSPGTPRYMAPEQLEDGTRAGAPSDVFAWGQLAHEILTGTLVPNSGSEPDAVERRLDQQVRDLPSSLGPLIGQALATAPEDRPSARELYEALRGAGELRGSIWRRNWTWGAVGTAAVAALVLLNARSQGEAGASDADGLLFDRPVAVAAFTNETGDPELDFLGRMAGDWITTGLRNLDGVKVVPWALAQEIVARAQLDTAVDPVPILESETDAGTVVTGRYYRVGDQISFKADITNASGREVIAGTNSVTSPMEQPEQALEELRERLLGAVSALSGDASGSNAVAGHAPRLDAYRLYDEGGRLHRSQEYGRALSSFLMAHEKDTTFLLPLLAGVASAGNIGDDPTFDSLMAYVGLRRDRLSRLDDLTWQYLDADARDDGQRALRALRETVLLAPGDRGTYNLAVVANLLNRPAEALDALALLDPDAGQAKGWAQYWTQMTHSLHLLGRHTEEVAAARQMVRRHPERTVAPSLLARALATSGEIDALDEALSASALRPPRTYWSHGGALLIAGQALMAHSSAEAAKPYLDEAERWLEGQIASDPEYQAHREWLSNVYYSQARWHETVVVLQELMERAPRNTGHRGMAAVVAAHLDDRGRVTRLLDAEGWPGPEASRLLYSARVAAVYGDFDRALSDLSSALDRGLSSWAWAHEGGHFEFALMRQDPRIERLLRPIALGS